jgi:hypothetical protein
MDTTDLDRAFDERQRKPAMSIMDFVHLLNRYRVETMHGGELHAVMGSAEVDALRAEIGSSVHADANGEWIVLGVRVYRDNNIVGAFMAPGRERQ